MASISTRNPVSSPATAVGQRLWLIVGLACLAGYAIDVLVFAVPPAIGSAAWRLGLLQHLSDRSIVLLLGFAALLYAGGTRRFLRQISLVSLIVGTLLVISCGLVAIDALALQQQAQQRISSQASQLNQRLETAQTDPKLKTQVTPEQLEQASNQVNNRAKSAQQTASASILKTGILIAGNLLISGLALMGLGNLGSASARK